MKSEMIEPLPILLSGLVSGTLCQKTSLTFAQVVDEWNSQFSKGSGQKVVRLSINHYASRTSSGHVADYLLMIEPRVTWPRHSGNLRSKYQSVYGANSECASIQCKPWLNQPLPEDEIPRILPATLPERFTIIAANKMSAVPGELYSLRRQVAYLAEDFTFIYGAGWRSKFFPKVKVVIAEFALALAFSKSVSFKSIKFFFRANWDNYQGFAASKVEAYSQAKFALVIENSMELRTEKLFDAIEAGAFPVYVGPRCEDGIPENLFIHAEPTIEGVLEAMAQARTIDFNEWWVQRLSWIDSPAHNTSSKDRFLEFLGELSRSR